MMPPIFSIDSNAFTLLKITASVYAPIPFVHALHVHAKHYLDDTNHSVEDVLLFLKVYTLVGFYQRIEKF